MKNIYRYIIFYSMSHERNMDEADPPPATQDTQLSRRVYSAVILFNYDVDNEFPFISTLLNNFTGTDFPFEIISGHLGLADRLKPRSLSKFPGKKFCVFAKVEEGIYWS